MFGRLIRYRAKRRGQVPLDVLFETIRTVRGRSDVIAITPTITGYSWMGVNRATHALFPDGVLDVPYVYGPACDALPYHERELELLCRFVAGQDFGQVVLSGFPSGFEFLARRFRGHGMTVGCLFHGFLSECGQNRLNSQPLKTILTLCREGVIVKLACNKKGLPATIATIAGVRAHKFMVPVRATLPLRPTIARVRGDVHIGVLGHDTFRKNIHNQIAAALMVEGARVHVAGTPNVVYWDCDERLVHHPETMPHGDYVNLLGQMDVNLHLSFSESWGQVTAESLAMGVPCIIANHSDILDYDGFLRKKLVSQNFDDPWELSKELKGVLAERDALTGRCRDYVEVLNQKAEALLQAFLEHEVPSVR